jgi:hypothetical protein
MDCLLDCLFGLPYYDCLICISINIGIFLSLFADPERNNGLFVGLA